jgi:hypothetical protein
MTSLFLTGSFRFHDFAGLSGRVQDFLPKRYFIFLGLESKIKTKQTRSVKL